MNKYNKLKKKQQEEFNKFPIYFAFNKKQLDNVIEKLDLKEGEKIVNVGSGGLIKKQDFKDLIKLYEKQISELKEFLKDNDNLYEAFIYELDNHEYCITGDFEDTLSALDLKFEYLTEEQLTVLYKAVKEYLSKCDDY